MNFLTISISIIVIVVSIALIISFKPIKKKEMTKSKKIAYIAILTAISAIFNIYSIDMGVKYVSLSFVMIPCFIAGYMLGFIEGFAVGFIGDIIGAIILPRGAYMPVIGIASGLLGFIPGIVFWYFKGNDFLKTVISFILCLIICTAFLNTFGLWLLYAMGKKSFWAYLSVRLPWQSIVTLINMSICLMLVPFLKKRPFENSEE